MTRKKVYLIVGGILGVFAGLGLLWLLVMRLLGDIITQILWGISISIAMIPQEVIWMALLMISTLIALFALRRPISVSRDFSNVPYEVDRRVQFLENWFNNRHRAFYRNRINFAVTRLATRVWALQGRVSEDEMKQAMRAGSLDLSEELLTYLQRGLTLWPDEPEYPSPFNLRMNANPENTDDRFNQVFSLLEKELEIHDDN